MDYGVDVIALGEGLRRHPDPPAPPTSGAREDDKLLGRTGHRDLAVDRSNDAASERGWDHEDDEVELQPPRARRNGTVPVRAHRMPRAWKAAFTSPAVEAP